MNEQIANIIDSSDAVLFDMDGVVVDTDNIHSDSKYAAAKSLGIEIEDSWWQEISQFTSAQIYHKILLKFPNLEVGEQEFVKRKSDFFANNIKKRVGEIPGAFEFVEKLKQHNIKTALVTASRMDTVKIVQEKFELEKYFDLVLSRENVKNPKPDPECYLKAAKFLGVDIENCVVFEDSLHGTASGVAAGAKVIGRMAFRSEEELLAAGAIIVFKDYKDLY